MLTLIMQKILLIPPIKIFFYYFFGVLSWNKKMVFNFYLNVQNLLESFVVICPTKLFEIWFIHVDDSVVDSKVNVFLK